MDAYDRAVQVMLAASGGDTGRDLDLVTAYAAAIRAAENEALERARKIAVEIHCRDPLCMARECCTGALIAAEIGALVDKEG